MNNQQFTEDKILKPANGILLLLLNILLIIGGFIGFIFSIKTKFIAGIFICIIMTIFLLINLGGFKVIRPNEARIFTLFGKYKGVIYESGFYYLNPFVSSITEKVAKSNEQLETQQKMAGPGGDNKTNNYSLSPRISMKTRTLLNNKQKINDELGNPIEIGIAVIWKIECVSMALFNVDNYKEYLSIQCDAVLRDIVRSYPYDSTDKEITLRASSKEISEKMEKEIQKKVEIAGLKIIDARITHLAYAPEIAQAMLQRQQASAVVDARHLIVEGAVGMVNMAIEKLSKEEIVELDEERKAQMVSNLMVVLCGNKEAQPIVNSGSIY